MKRAVLNQSVSAYRKNLYNIYHTKILPAFESIEQERKKQIAALSAYVSLLGVLLLLSAIGTYYEFVGLSGGSVPTFNESLYPLYLVSPILTLILIGIIAWLMFDFNKKFVTKLKIRCMPKVLSTFGNMRWYDCADLIANSTLRRSQLFGQYNTRTSFDAFEGSYKDVPFKISETDMKLVTGSGKNRRVEQIFKGVIINFKSNKTIRNTTIIATRGDRRIKNSNAIGLVTFLAIAHGAYDVKNSLTFNLICIGILILITLIVMWAINKFSKQEEVLDEIKLEDPEFNKKYRAYSSDQVEGRYLITPAFMERFKNIQTAFGAKNAKCSFCGDDLMFAISTDKNLFEIGNLYHRLSNPKQVEQFFNELSSILALIDYFKLDEKTGL